MDRTQAPSSAPKKYLSQADEALRQARLAATDKAAHAAVTYERPALSPRGVAALDRVANALGVR